MQLSRACSNVYATHSASSSHLNYWWNFHIYRSLNTRESKFWSSYLNFSRRLMITRLQNGPNFAFDQPSSVWTEVRFRTKVDKKSKIRTIWSQVIIYFEEKFGWTKSEKPCISTTFSKFWTRSKIRPLHSIESFNLKPRNKKDENKIFHSWQCIKLIIPSFFVNFAIGGSICIICLKISISSGAKDWKKLQIFAKKLWVIVEKSWQTSDSVTPKFWKHVTS